jgi:hypothetical protein
MSSHMYRIEQSTYDLGGFAAEVGGLFKALDLLFTLSVSFLGQFGMWALLANLLYKNDDNNDLILQ